MTPAAARSSSKASPTQGRLKKLREKLKEHKLDGLIINSRVASLYYTGFPCSNSVLLITAKEAVFLTDFRYLAKARAELNAWDVRAMTQHAHIELTQLLKQLQLKQVGFEGSVPYLEYVALKKAAGRTKLEESGKLLRALRAVKEPWEIDIIAANQKLNQKLFSQALGRVRSGKTEQAIQREIRQAMLEQDVEEAFTTIIAAGANSANPHAIVGKRAAKTGEYLLFDMGVKKNAYHSDMTRTVVLGNASARHREIYDVVLKAQQAALKAVRPGAVCREVDAIARGMIAEAGYGNNFGHGLGHGVGLEIHEAPTLGPRSADVLEEGMVVTVEPGVYIPDFGGVRIEDLVVVTRDGFKNLTSVSKQFTVV